MSEEIEQISTDTTPVVQKKKLDKCSLAFGILSFITIALLIGVVAFMFVYYIPNFSDPESTEVIGLLLLIPFIIGFLVFLGLLSICLLVLGILNLKGLRQSTGTKVLAIFTIVMDFIAVAGLAFLVVLRPKLDIFYTLSVVYMFAFAIFEIVALRIKVKGE